MYAKITGTGSYLPDHLMDNFELSEMVDTSDEWIQSRTGIKARHIAEQDTVVSMAVSAAKEAIRNAGIEPAGIDLVIVSSVSAEQILPCAACEVQAAIGADNAAAFDLNAACTGFISAYQVAAAQMKAGLIRTALVIGSECLSNLIDWTDRGTCILFGDGAGAAVITCQDSNIEVPFVLHSDGAKGAALSCSSGFGAEKSPYGNHIFMDGRAIYKFAVKQIPQLIHEILEQSGRSVEEIDLFLLHQANERIITSIAKHLQQDISKFPMNLQENGNISSASIPVLLDDLNRQGKLKPGMKLIVAGFGAGLTWGGIYLEW